MISTTEIKFPSIAESEPDKDGIITITEYKFNENNQKIKTVKKIKRYSVHKKLYKSTEERQKNWVKFGEALAVDNSKITYISPVDIFMEDPRPEKENKGKKDIKQKEEKKCICINQSTRDIIDLVLNVPLNKRDKYENELVKTYDQLIKKNKMNGFETLIVKEQSDIDEEITLDPVEKSKTAICRTCGGDHWTRFCPKTTVKEETNNVVEYDEKIEDSILSRTIIVSNLNKDTTEENIFELFSPMGQINKLYIAKDYETQVSKGYSFVTFLHKKDAEKSIEKLNNRGFEHLLLNISWAKGKNSN